MVDVLDLPTLPEMGFLQQLAEDLESTLSVIAFTNHSEDRSWIEKRQKEIREQYGPYIGHCISDVATFHITPAYQVLQDLLEFNKTPEEIMQDCEDCLHNHLWTESPGLESETEAKDYLGEFEKFYRENQPK